MALDLNNNMPTGYSNYFSGCIPVLNMKELVSDWLYVKKLFRTTRVLFLQPENQGSEPHLPFIYPQPNRLCIRTYF